MHFFNVPNMRCLYSPNIVVMGDSRTFVNWNKVMDRNDIVPIRGGQIQNLLPHVDFVKKLRPKLCLIMVGINDMFWMKTPEKTFNDYKSLIDSLKSDDYQIVIQSVLYVASNKIFYREQNQEVDMLNAMLKEYSEKNGIIYLDLNTHFEINHVLNMAYSSDGVHINRAGYQLWRKQLEPLLGEFDLQ